MSESKLNVTEFVALTMQGAFHQTLYQQCGSGLAMGFGCSQASV
jgi:hypothetical protein